MIRTVGLEWRPSASQEMLRRRAGLLAGLRAFFVAAGVLEVETPILSAAGNPDPAIDSLSTTYGGPDAPPDGRLWLHTSPEFAMKRLLAAGSGPIYQICKVFRDGERGGRHNPEFTMLEWYRPGFDSDRLIDEVAALVNGLLDRPRPVERITYGELFRQAFGIDPHRAEVDQLRRIAAEQGIAGVGSLQLDGRDGWLDLLLSHRIEPALGLGTLCFVHDYPATQAALAQLRPGLPPVAERFELYMDGVEIANGFHELQDPTEQRRRLLKDVAERHALGRDAPALDERFLAALEAGLPGCSGVALGVDRLLMRLVAAREIDEVIAFPLGRA